MAHLLCTCDAQLQPHDRVRNVCPSACRFLWSEVKAARHGGPTPRCVSCGEEAGRG